jgi:hypothetical protein
MSSARTSGRSSVAQVTLVDGLRSPTSSVDSIHAVTTEDNSALASLVRGTHGHRRLSLLDRALDFRLRRTVEHSPFATRPDAACSVRRRSRITGCACYFAADPIERRLQDSGGPRLTSD